MMFKKKDKIVDDGRVIAKMNVDGMPWYSKNVPSQTESTEEPIELTKKEKRAMIRGVLAAALTVGLVFIAVFAIFILFCLKVWLV